MICVGIDPSLTATGVAVIDTEDVLHITCDTVGSTGRRDASWDERLHRVAGLARDVAAAVPDGACVAMEAPSLGQKHQAGVVDRHGLTWFILAELRDQGVPVTMVPPTTRAKYATGRGNSGKDAVLLAASRRYPQAPMRDNNQADAVILAAYLARVSGHPIEDTLPKTHLEAIKEDR